MTIQDFQQWLDRYGNAWMAGDPEGAARLFSADAAYYEAPFDQPMVGTGAIRRYWEAGAKNAQSEVSFEATPICVSGNTGFARWRATFRRVPSNAFVELDGVLSATFGDGMRCDEFREWWHRRETAAA